MTNNDQTWGATGQDGPSAQTGATPKEMAQAAVQTVKDEARSFAATAQEKAAGKLEAQQATVTRTIGDFAEAIRKAGDDLSANDQSLAARVVKGAADGLESFSRSIGDKRPQDLLDGVRDFGRRNPVAFMAGAVLLGVALGRVAKSTAKHDGAADGLEPTEDMGSYPSLAEASFGEGRTQRFADDPASTAGDDVPASGSPYRPTQGGA